MLPEMIEDWRTPAVDELCDALLTLRTRDEAAAFLRDICSLSELEALSHRLATARMLEAGLPYTRIAVGAARLDGDRHPRRPLAQPRRGRLPAGAGSDGRAMSRPFRLALPSKGRMHAPAMELAREAGIEVETNGRALHLHCPRWGIEVLLARSDDIPVWAQDGAVEAAIAGRNQLVESASTAQELLALGFGRCTLQVAVSSDSACGARPTSRGAGSPPPTR